MTSPDLAAEIVQDLFRSSWIIERAREQTYRGWAENDPAQGEPAEIAARRAELIATVLEREGVAPDEALVPAHAAWIASVIGERPDAVALSPMFLARLGDWVDAHAAPFLDAEGTRLQELGLQGKAHLTFPSAFPSPPAYEPLVVDAPEPPGDVLFTFGILSDMHIGSPHATERVRAAIADLNRSGAELVIQLGDITDRGHRAEFEEAAKLLAELEMPFATMMGNHDVFSIEEQRLSGREYYGENFGRAPDGVMLERRGFRFAVLDSIEHSASPFSPFDLVTGQFIEDQPGGAIVRGTLSPPQHEILADLAGPDGGPAFVFLHHPVQPYTGFPPVLFGLRDADSERLHAVCDSRNVWGIFAGHTHRNARTREFDGVPAHEVGIPRDFPHGYALVDVCPNGYRYRFVQLSNEDLLREAYAASGELMRRYTRGRDADLSFVWTLSA